MPERVHAQEGEVPVQVDHQIAQGGGGTDAIFVGEDADARELIQETVVTSAPSALSNCNRHHPRRQS